MKRIAAILALLAATALACPPPVPDDNPDISVNNGANPAVIRQGSPVMLTVSLVPGLYNGKRADWWVLAYTPAGWFHYNVACAQWYPGFAVSYQGPLFYFLHAVILFTTDLPPGEYMVYFGFDCIVNGQADLNAMSLDAEGFVIR